METQHSYCNKNHGERQAHGRLTVAQWDRTLVDLVAQARHYGRHPLAYSLNRLRSQAPLLTAAEGTARLLLHLTREEAADWRPGA